jgi:flagellar biosynthesis protein FlhB
LVKNFFTFQTMMNFFKNILKVKRHGFTAMMSKQKPSLYNESQKSHTEPKIARQILSNVKVLFTLFWL